MAVLALYVTSNHKLNCEYRIARNFQGLKFSRISLPQTFRNLIFEDGVRIYSLPHQFYINLTAPTASNMSKDDWKVDLMASESVTYYFQAMAHGYHVYRDICIAAVSEELSCVRETDNHWCVSSSSWCYNAKYFEGQG